MAHNCCINGCKNRYSPASQIKFHRIPSGTRVFQTVRRQLWLDFILRANGNTNKLNQFSRICGDHFISGEASPDPDMPDYVPSVFTKQRPTPKRRRVEWIYRFRKRRRRSATAGTESESFSGLNSPEKRKSSASVLHEKDCSKQEEVELKTEEFSAKTVCLRSASKPKTVSPSLTESTGIPVPQQMSPVVVLKSVVLPAGGFRCDLCHQASKDVTEFINHYQLHHVQPPSITDEAPETAEATGNGEEPLTASETPATGEATIVGEAPAVEARCVPVDQPSFPCNMCDRSFTTSQNLKRHKLLHVKDGRKCAKCGALFCRRHRHILFQPRVEPMKEPEKDSISEEKKEEVEEVVVKKEEPLEPSAITVNNQPIKVEPIEAAEKINKPQILPLAQLQRHIPVICVLPLPRIQQIAPKPLPLSLPGHIQTPVTSANLPAIPPPPTSSSNSMVPTLNPNSLPGVHPRLPPSLELFSPQRLTSSLLEVKRNYDYILSKPKKQQEFVVQKRVEPVLFLSESEAGLSSQKRKSGL
ncbi:hypothetical protein OJAV_G00068850 [Oryzias javanicus]|uniref:C2H2-type domain-containing protein n=1 Tax=Oryzias javanicus TaxID=123683 RepID=A0A437D848_ORYJA|nr:hypothetical protein OJAV_G00068850 [Oryzias javanicus]